MSGPAEVIQAEIGDPRTVFVFPSEVAARFWLRRAFTLTSRRALPQGRFIAWDRFKRETLRYSAPGREADEASRTLFVAALLEENRAHGFLRRLVPPEHRDNSAAFLRFLKQALPVLHRVQETGGGAAAPGAPALDPDKRADLLEVLHRYRTHLARTGRYEPTYETARFAPDTPKRWLLFFTEILEDFPFFAGLLAGRPEVEVVPSRLEELPGEPVLEAFENTLEELTDRLLRIGELLDGGVPPEEIALTVAALEEAEPTLRILARRYEVPLSFRRRRPLADWPQGRIFRRISELVESGFSFPAFRDLLLSPAIPWREERLARELVRFGAEHRIFRNYALRGERLDLWAAGLEKALAAPSPAWPVPLLQELRRFYRRLKEDLEALVGAATLQELRDRVNRLTADYFELTRWDEEQKRVYLFARSTLGELAAGGEAPIGPPWPLWLEYLDQKEYVPQEEPGISVYPYPLSAGIGPEHHFVVNAAQAGTRRIIPRYPFLSAQEEPAEAREIDLSEPTIRLYALSGRDVAFSYGRVSLGGAQLPPAFFISSGRIASAPEPEEKTTPDLYALERLLWERPGFVAAPPDRLYPPQKRGLGRALRTGLGRKRLDIGRQVLEDAEDRRRLLARLEREDGLLSVSPTSLEIYASCGFRYLFERGLRITELQCGPVMWDDREFGDLMHRIFQRFYGRLVGQTLQPAQAERYREILQDETERVLAAYAEANPLPLAPIWQEKTRQVRSLAQEFLARELEEFAGQEVLGTEVELERRFPEEGLRLTGKIDRISQAGGRLGLVDYKKKRAPKPEAIFGPEPTSYQIPFYVLLMESEGRPPEWAAYYSIEDRKYRFLFHPERKAEADADTIRRAAEAVMERIRDMVRGLRQGDFRRPERPGAQSCAWCPLRGICRSRFIPLE